MYLKTTAGKRGDKACEPLHLVESVRARDGKVRQKNEVQPAREVAVKYEGPFLNDILGALGSKGICALLIGAGLVSIAVC